MDNSVLANQRIRSSRERSHLLKEAEFKTIQYLCRIMPKWVSPDLLTITGLTGSVVVFLGLYGATFSRMYLILSVIGLAIHWLGDSLDGRLAYYRNIPRKWYGWALDLNADWVSICIIGIGFYLYFPSYKILSFLFVVAYGGSMILSLLRYKITSKYVIDKASLGPTELRIILSIILIIEIIVPSTLMYFSGIATLAMLVINAKESVDILAEGDERDILEKELKKKNN